MNKALQFMRDLESARPNPTEADLINSLGAALATQQIGLIDALEVAWYSGVQRGRLEEVRAAKAA